MAVTFILLDGTSEKAEPRPGMACKDFVIEEGIIAEDPSSFNVTNTKGDVVDDQPIEQYDNQKLTISLTVIE